MDALDTVKNNNGNRMSFIFPQDFKQLLLSLKGKYGKDMTYIIIDAVNEWVIRKESITPVMIKENGGS